MNRYMGRAAVAWQHDDAVWIRVNEVLAMVRRSEALLAPAFVLRVLRVARRGPVAPPAAGPVGADAQASGGEVVAER